jgi:hypothetical protein
VPPATSPPPAGGRAQLALLPLISLVAGWRIHQPFERQRGQAQARLMSLAERWTTQVENWLAQFMAQASFLSSSPLFADQFVAWVDHGDQGDQGGATGC